MKLKAVERARDLVKNRRKIIQKKREALDALTGKVSAKLFKTQPDQHIKFYDQEFSHLISLDL